MKILVVCRQTNGRISPFIAEQVNAIKEYNLEVDYCYISQNGITGYLKGYLKILKFVYGKRYDIVHGHYGLSGFLCCLQSKVPAVVTFHGCDVNQPKNRKLARITKRLSCRRIYVTKELAVINKEEEPTVIPCGVDFTIFKPIDKGLARRKMELDDKKKFILFSSSFDTAVKNYPLAREAINLLNNENIELIELKGYTREEVALLMNSVDLVLLTSNSEGSPQFIKEALACQAKIVSTDVGDVRRLLADTEGNFVVDKDPNKIAEAIKTALFGDISFESSEFISELDNRVVAKRVIDVYKDCLKSKQN
jgi:glycosyltransferase involved in cell wall biosynthesis